MEVYYQGTDITDMVQVKSCIVRDAAGSRCDSLQIEFENAAGWYSWGPEEDDQIIVAHSGYDSGVMYVNKILPEDGVYKILATSLPCKARNKEYKSFYQKTIEEIIRSCGMASGMDFQMLGVDGGTVIPYIERRDEGCAAFLHKLLTLESAALKCINGKYVAISYAYANDLTATQTVTLAAKQEGTRYRRDGSTYKGLTIKTPYAAGSAEDALVTNSHARLTISGQIPALNDIQAARWARGKLLHLNRQCERVNMKTDYNPGMTALARIDIEGDTDATGEWLVEEVEHDFIELKSDIVLHRCVRTIK